MVGLRADGTAVSRRIERDLAREAIASRMAAYLEQRIEKGGLIEAVARTLIYIRFPEGKFDERGFAAWKQISAELPAAERIGLIRLKEIVHEQYLILLQDGERAIAALPKLLPEDRQREETLTMLRRLLSARGELSGEGRRRLERIEAIFAGPPPETGRDKAA
jgi:hypothetical protein